MASTYPPDLQERSVILKYVTKVSKNSIQALVSPHGTVEHVQCACFEDGKPLSYVIMSSVEEAEALAGLPSPKIGTQAIKIQPVTNTQFQDLVLGLPANFGLTQEESQIADALALLKRLGLDTGKPGGQPGEDIKLIHNTPKISYFYGSERKGEVSYELWKHEVKCLMKDESLSDQVKSLAIRRSLRGQAGNRVCNLSESASPDEILVTLDSIYESALPKESIVGKFFSAKQLATEDVADWSVRLENLLDKALQKGMQLTDDRDTLLCTRFFIGLRERDLKVACRHLYQEARHFQDFRAEVRALEQELAEEGLIVMKQDSTAASSTGSSRSTKATSNMQIVDGVAAQIISRLDAIEQRLGMGAPAPDSQGQGQPSGQGQGQRFKGKRKWRKNKQKQNSDGNQDSDNKTVQSN